MYASLRLHFHRRSALTVLWTVLAVLAAAYAVVPMVLVLAGSVDSNPANIFTYWDPLSLKAIVPPGFSGASYSAAVNGSFGTALLNSIIVAAGTVIVGLAMSILAAFALAVSWSSDWS